MRILKIADGFITNSSSANALVILALRKGKELAAMLEKLGIPGMDAYRFDDSDDIISDLIEDNEIDKCVKDLMQDYDLLASFICIGAYGDDLESVGYEDGEHTEFRNILFETISRVPKRLIGNDLLLLESVNVEMERFSSPLGEETRHKRFISSITGKNYLVEKKSPLDMNKFIGLKVTIHNGTVVNIIDSEDNTGLFNIATYRDLIISPENHDQKFKLDSLMVKIDESSRKYIESNMLPIIGRLIDDSKWGIILIDIRND